KLAPGGLEYDIWYTYDLAGNRVLEDRYEGVNNTRTWYEHNAFNQCYLTTSTTGMHWSYEFDLNGNQTTTSECGSINYAYARHHNRENRLVENRVGDIDSMNDADFVYDYTGRLLMKTGREGDKSKYYYDGINTLLMKEKL